MYISICLRTNLVRPKTIDWIEFRDLLYPIVTGRYLERHFRQLFDLFDTRKIGFIFEEGIIGNIHRY
jgi:hypothetical protein